MEAVLLNPSIYRELKGEEYLLIGPPGNGKTLLARAVAADAGRTFIPITSSFVTNMWQGESEKRVEAIWQLAVEMRPSLVFIGMLGKLKEIKKSSI